MTSSAIKSLVAPGVCDLQPYTPGKPIEALEREYGIRHAVKLASNENPLGPSPLGIAAARDVIDKVHYYPDGYALTAKLAAYHGLDSACFTLGNGSNDVLDMIARAFLTPEHNAVYSEHAFIVYAIATKAVGAASHIATALPETDVMPYGHDLDAMYRLIDDNTRVVFIANPNNPTGTWLTKESLKDFIDSVPRHVIVVLDEAYIEYTAGRVFANGLEWLQDSPNLVVTRTFSKIYGLAGLRCGYSISSPEIADYLNRVRHPFNVNNLALVAAEAALDDQDFLNESVRVNREGMTQLTEAFSAMGLAVLPSAGNFLTVNVGPLAGGVYEGLLQKGVIVRPVANYQLPNHLRITIGRPNENQQVIEALTAVLNNGHKGD